VRVPDAIEGRDPTIVACHGLAIDDTRQRAQPSNRLDDQREDRRPVVPVLWSWSGLYLGGHIGSAMGLDNINDPLGPSIFGDLVHSPGYLVGGQIGYNWQAPGSYWVFGVEADATWANLDGTNTCYAFSGTFTSFNCRANTNSFGTLTGRVGWAFGPSGRSLAYVKGGAAWANSNVDMIINNDVFGDVGGNTANTGITSWGWTLGAGAEYAMTAHWTVRAEYDYLDLGSKNVLAPNPSVITAPTVPLVGAFFPVPGTTVSQQIHVFKLGLNYKFGSDVAPFAGGVGWPAVAVGYPTKGPIYRGARDGVGCGLGGRGRRALLVQLGPIPKGLGERRQHRPAESHAQYLTADLGQPHRQFR
jgi:opacity protein-like surface antigen